MGAAQAPARTPTRTLRFRPLVAQAWTTLVAAFLSLFVLIPFGWAFLTAVKSHRELSRNPLGIPIAWQWGNFPGAWTRGHFGRYFMNSVYVALPTVALVLVCSTLAAYAFSQMKFRGKSLLFGMLLIGLAVPLSILIIPLHYEMLALGLLNTYAALILPQVAKTLPFGIVLLRSFMEDFPVEILDAARIDGCSRWGVLWRVVVPLSTPALTSLTVFASMWTWNQFILPMVLIRDNALRTLPVGLNYFQGQFLTDIPMLMAGAMISAVPIVLLYMLFQRQFINGMTAGAFR